MKKIDLPIKGRKATKSHRIGTLNEKPLHAGLKSWYSRPGDKFEVPVDGYVIDIKRGNLLIEIQTRSFASIKKKLIKLLENHKGHLVYPITQTKWINRIRSDGTLIGRRKSPKQGTVVDLFDELLRFPELVSNPNFSLEAVLIHEDEIRKYDSRKGWRRKGWITHKRKLIKVLKSQIFKNKLDYLKLFSPVLKSDRFTTKELSAFIRKPRWIAQRIAYCLKKMGAIVQVDKHGNTIVYAKAL